MPQGGEIQVLIMLLDSRHQRHFRPALPRAIQVQKTITFLLKTVWPSILTLRTEGILMGITHKCYSMPVSDGKHLKKRANKLMRSHSVENLSL